MKNSTIMDFIEVTSSNSPTPGGGSVAALLASLSASLSAMSANLTIGKKGNQSIANQTSGCFHYYNNNQYVWNVYSKQTGIVDLNSYRIVVFQME